MGLTAENDGAYEKSFKTPKGDKDANATEENSYETTSQGNLTGTVDTTDVGAGEGALLQTNAAADFGVSPTRIDGADPTDGENPLLVTNPEPLTEDNSAAAKKAEKERQERIQDEEDEQDEARLAREESGSTETVEGDKQRDSQGNVSDTEPAPGVAVEAANAEEDAKRLQNAQEEGTYDPAEHTAPEVLEYLKGANKAEVSRVKREEKKHKPKPRTTILDFQPEK